MTAVLALLDGLEIRLCLRINRYSRTTFVRRFFSIVSRLGDGTYWVVVAIGILVHRGPEAAPFLLRAAVTAGTGLVIYRVLKRRLVRERPYVTNSRILCGTRPLDRYSFPSGHTMHAVSFTTMFAHFEPMLIFVTAPFAALVAASRIVLGLHYPSDVLVGAAIGGALAMAGISLTA